MVAIHGDFPASRLGFCSWIVSRAPCAGRPNALDRRALAADGPHTPAQVAQRAEAWRPWRGYAAMYLWSGDAAEA